jgi:20S proteasome subunit beta 2
MVICDALYDAGGSLGVNLILGGYDVKSKLGRLTATHPHGSMDVVPFAALGSGGLAAMAVLESRYHPGLSREQGMELVKSAVLAGIKNDLGSGSQVDMCVLGPKGAVEYTRGVIPEQQLTANEEEQEDEFTSQEKTSNGVNGFGNLPFSVNSRRVVASQQDESTRLEKWDALLGFK